VRVASVPVTVSASGAALPPSAAGATFDPDLAWRPTRGDLWRLAFGMWKERPFAGFGSDRFRWLYGLRAGRRFWDVRVFANNTVLETAATTGTLGVLALLATFLVSAVAAARALAASSGADGMCLALLGLLAGLFAHGLVDYVLAFTGHYLLFGFVVGSCAGLATPAPRA
jgi:O-antigen ligase